LCRFINRRHQSFLALALEMVAANPLNIKINSLSYPEKPMMNDLKCAQKAANFTALLRTV
jgi:hypothetical protein